jgi:hypothetical protein
MPPRCSDLGADVALEAWLDALGHAWVGNGTYREPQELAVASRTDRREAATDSCARAPLDPRAVRRGLPVTESA